MTKEKDMVCRLKKALYGLKQAPRTWYARLHKYVAKLGFAKGTIDSNLYLKEIEDGLLIIIVFFDDTFFEEMMKPIKNSRFIRWMLNQPSKWRT